jgi:energy-coupling factor transporter ATP-binding protein EcfA2
MSSILKVIFGGVIPLVFGTVNCALSLERFPQIDPLSIQASKWSAQNPRPIYQPSPNWIIHFFTGALITGYGIANLGSFLNRISTKEEEFDLGEFNEFDEIEDDDSLNRHFKNLEIDQEIQEIKGVGGKENVVPITAKRASYPDRTDFSHETKLSFEQEDEIDFEELIIDHTFSPNSSKHLMVVSQSGSGKTTTLARLIKSIWDHTKGEGEFLISSVKSECIYHFDTIQGLDGLPCVISIFNEKNIPVLYQRIKNVLTILNSRDEHAYKAKKEGKTLSFSPVFLVMDEWQTTMSIIRSHDTKIADEIEKMVSQIILLGREYSVILWVFSQNHQVQNLGKTFNSGMQVNLGTFILGSSPSKDSLELALDSKYAIVDGSIGKPLWNEAKRLMDKGNYVAFTDIQDKQIIKLSEFDRFIPLTNYQEV